MFRKGERAHCLIQGRVGPRTLDVFNHPLNVILTQVVWDNGLDSGVEDSGGRGARAHGGYEHGVIGSRLKPQL